MRDCFFDDCGDRVQLPRDECTMQLLIIITITIIITIVITILLQRVLIVITIASDLGREGPQPARGWCGAKAILATMTLRKKLEFLSALVVLLNLLQRFQTMLPETFCSRAFGISPLATVGDA